MTGYNAQQKKVQQNAPNEAKIVSLFQQTETPNKTTIKEKKPDLHITCQTVISRDSLLVVVFPHACLGILLYNYTRFNVSKTATNPRVKISKAYYESLCLWHRRSVSSEKQMWNAIKKKQSRECVSKSRGDLHEVSLVEMYTTVCVVLSSKTKRSRPNAQPHNCRALHGHLTVGFMKNKQKQTHKPPELDRLISEKFGEVMYSQVFTLWWGQGKNRTILEWHRVLVND